MADDSDRDLPLFSFSSYSEKESWKGRPDVIGLQHNAATASDLNMFWAVLKRHYSHSDDADCINFSGLPPELAEDLKIISGNDLFTQKSLIRSMNNMCNQFTLLDMPSQRKANIFVRRTMQMAEAILFGEAYSQTPADIELDGNIEEEITRLGVNNLPKHAPIGLFRSDSVSDETLQYGKGSFFLLDEESKVMLLRFFDRLFLGTFFQAIFP